MQRLTFSFFAAALLAAPQSPPAASEDFFESKVRPILASQCYACHTNSKLGNLRVDSAESLAKGGKRGPAVVPGDPDKSLLIQAVRHADSELKMPMGSKLKQEEIEALEAWVKAGAAWPASAATSAAEKKDGRYLITEEARKFWSFLPLRSVEPPAVKDAKWPKTGIDRFILAKLESEGIKPVRPASKRDLIRRATLGLTGLPATYEEVQAFEKDTSPDAWAKVVDRLMASPHYGERWGRIWLDVARYGEDDYRSLDPMRRGFNPYPNAYLYRDWVIQAFNDDMPYDLFVKSQLAGDLLDEKIRHKTLPGTGFLGLGPWYYDNGAVEVTRADERHDRVDVVTRGFLGLTVACARCHDHKYDPIPATDYYSLAGVFNSSPYHEYPQVPKSIYSKYEQIEEEIERKQKLLRDMQTNLTNQLSQSLAFQTAAYLEAVYEVTGSLKREKAQVVETRKLDYELLDRWIAYMEKSTDKYPYKKAWQEMMKRPRSTPQEAKRLAEEFQLAVVKLMLEKNQLSEENEIIAAKALEGTRKKRRARKPNEFITNDDFCPNCALRLKNLSEEDMSFWTEIFQRELRDADDPNAMMAMGGRMGRPGVLLFRGWGLESRVGAESQAMIAKVRDDIEAARKKLEPYYPYIHGVSDADEPANLPVSIRGDPYNLGEEVPRHFVSVLCDGEPEPFTKGSGRLELAEAIVRQPLALRVIVNRVWKGHFGTGLVDSPSNFGRTGERPTNPELLEYLTSTFVKNGMSIKNLHREILLSSVYQLSTEDNQLAYEKDSGNRLYWRHDRKRLDAEQLRDSVLAAAGNLDKSLGGPSGELQPSFLRRTVYGKVSRYKLDQYLQLFDFPSPNISAEKRFVTTVPLQRLFLMNSDFMQYEAEEFVKRVALEPDNRARIRKTYRILYGRDATEAEIAAGAEYLKKEPLLAYEEAKKRPPSEPGAGGAGRRGRGAGMGPGGPGANAPLGPPPGEGQAADAGQTATAVPDAGDPMMGMGMMQGMFPGLGGPGGRRGPGRPAVEEVKYEATAWGRYVKALMSSSEFLFVD